MPAPDVAPLAAPAALGRSRAGPGRALTAPTAGFDFSGFAGFFGSGSAFAEGRIFSEGFSMTGFAFATGAGSAGAATGAGAGAAWGRPRDAGLTTRTGRDIGTKMGALRGRPTRRSIARKAACARTERAAVRPRGARPPLEALRNGRWPGKGGRARCHGAPSLLSSVTMPRLSTPSRLSVSMVSTTTPYVRLRSAFR